MAQNGCRTAALRSSVVTSGRGFTCIKEHVVVVASCCPRELVLKVLGPMCSQLQEGGRVLTLPVLVSVV